MWIIAATVGRFYECEIVFLEKHPMYVFRGTLSLVAVPKCVHDGFLCLCSSKRWQSVSRDNLDSLNLSLKLSFLTKFTYAKFKQWRNIIMTVPLLNFEGGPGIPPLNIEGDPGVTLLNFRGVPSPTFKLWGRSLVPGSWGPGPAFTPCIIARPIKWCDNSGVHSESVFPFIEYFFSLKTVFSLVSLSLAYHLVNQLRYFCGVFLENYFFLLNNIVNLTWWT